MDSQPNVNLLSTIRPSDSCQQMEVERGMITKKQQHMCTLHLINPAIDVNSTGSLNVNMVKLTSGWYYKMYNIATNVDLDITIHNDKANSLILLPFMSIHLSCKLMVWWVLA